MSKELKDNTVIGKHKGFALICDPTVTLKIIANQLDDQNYTFWRIGKAACEAKALDVKGCAESIIHAIFHPSVQSFEADVLERAAVALRGAYAAGIANAKPTGWRVEIASVQERPLSPEMLWKCELYNHDTSILSWSIPHTSKAGLKQYLKPLIDFLHAEVRVVPMEKKGDAK